ncbi:MAG: PadR family transcriptional regulator [Thermodesulfobacteriota bacterium]|nr:PadR family transcriptional regulator [Thermodesulfobacteriota bacterium]
MKTRVATEYILMGSLMKGPMHGYEILQFLDSSLGSTWRLSTSQLYVLLKRLEEKDLLTSVVEIQNTRPPKRVFSLTPSGKKTFLKWLQSPTLHVRDLRIEFLAKLFFFHRHPLKGGSKLIKAQAEILEQLRKKIQERQKREKDPHHKLVLGFKTTTLEAWRKWLFDHAEPFVTRRHDRA